MKGYFRPRHPERYKGDPKNIVYRSSWELKVMTFLDRSPSVKTWSSEEVIVPYTDYSTNPPSRHRYFPDFVVEKTSGETLMAEVKPAKETVPPIRKTARQTRRYIKEVMTFTKNQSKWEAARRYCAARGWKFVVLTEKELGL